MEILKSATKICLLAIVFGVMIFTGLSIEITEPMKTIALLVVGAYFGKGYTKQNENGTK